MRKSIRRINEFTVLLFLTLIYIAVVGVCCVLYMVFHKRVKGKKSYWIESTNEKNIPSFTSAY